ncbi:MFS transporter [Janibacter melonis]|jgi:NNP family nitrate/nitrite transporter-like MFS transporter|uniref:MFS transporter n=1 Tax=Janibacter melonis TaxID=262209 RepID=A0A5P8FJS4_9MICO|nr:MFS transporter [Janibacter melonis]MCB5992865.1 MFS transporter [Janibacter melonis]QFQ29767.1 MFS transporter [Janibacter melonis]
MSTTALPGSAAPDEALAPPQTSPAPTGPVVGPGRWVEHWDPEDPVAWEHGGRRLARRNLGLSVYAEFLGFCVWALWSVVVPQLPAAGIPVTLGEQFWLVSLPALVGATLRVPYSFAVTKVGGRNWTVVSALLLLLPTLALAWSVSTQQGFGVLLACAALAGLGGGNFASSMTNISFFFPEAAKGRALGINAAGGNLGTGIVQMVIPAVVAVGAGIHLEYAGLVMVPLVLLAAVLAWRGMDNLREARSDLGSYRDACRRRDTWVISVLYIGTFGSFVGYSAAFPTLLVSQFPEQSPYVAFVGAVVGALTRPLGGSVADRLGGARVTIAAFAVMAAGAVGAVLALAQHSFVLFVASFVVMFAGSGIGNGATYRMIPAVFRAGVSAADLPRARRAAAACIGIAGAVGAYGGFLIPQGLRLARTELGSLVPALWVFVAAYVLMGLLTWARYARRGSALAEHTV